MTQGTPGERLGAHSGQGDSSLIAFKWRPGSEDGVRQTLRHEAAHANGNGTDGPDALEQSQNPGGPYYNDPKSPTFKSEIMNSNPWVMNGDHASYYRGFWAERLGVRSMKIQRTAVERLVALLAMVCALSCGGGIGAVGNSATEQVASSPLAGTWDVSICRSACGGKQDRRGNVLAKGKIVILAREDPAFGQSLRQYYPYCNACSDSVFAHVQLCYRFPRMPADTTLPDPADSTVRDTIARLGPYAHGFSNIAHVRSDSISFELGRVDDAGYYATVAVKGDSMQGSATGWGGSQAALRIVIINGRRTMAWATAEEMARTAHPMDFLIGSRTGPPDERICRGER